jgi:hypothetical protein
MQKIPTMFERDWAGDKSRVLDVIHPGCEWVAAGEGVATRKIDGTCCMVRDGKLYKRREIRDGELIPEGFEHVEADAETGKVIGWVPVGDGPEDRWHRQAFFNEDDGTYELVGPKIQGNPEKLPSHMLVHHGVNCGLFVEEPPRTFEGLREWLKGRDIEGIVFHHPDGRRAKIKKRDFGLKRSVNATQPS